MEAIGWMSGWEQVSNFSFQSTGAWVVWLNAFIRRDRMNLDYSKVLMALETLNSILLQITTKHMH